MQIIFTCGRVSTKQKSMARLSALFVIVMFALTCVATSFADPVPPPEDKDGTYQVAEEGKDNGKEEDFSGTRRSSNAKIPIRTELMSVADEKRPDKLVRNGNTLIKKSKGKESVTNMGLASKSKIDTTSRVGCGRACWCSLDSYTRCLTVPTTVYHVRYFPYGSYSCDGDVFYNSNKICIRPLCCACVIYLRA